MTAVNVTVNYSDGPVYNLVRTTACSAGGDSGGAHFAGSTALGIHSGSSGCTGSALHQPVREALSAYGVSRSAHGTGHRRHGLRPRLTGGVGPRAAI